MTFYQDKERKRQGSEYAVQTKKEEEEKRRRNMTGIPDDVKMHYESLSGFPFDDVRVHYNSDKPAGLQALAYTQGNRVYIGPGQEKHLEHELGHVVQQKRGEVKPNGTLEDGTLLNDSAELEQEAEQMAKRPGNRCRPVDSSSGQPAGQEEIVQRYIRVHAPGGDFIQSASLPGRADRRVMVKEGETGTVYIKKGMPTPPDLVKLGIKKDGDVINDPNNAPGIRYKRLRQDRIPDISGLAPGGRHEKQPLRSQADKGEATARLQHQRLFLNRTIGFLNRIAAALGGPIVQQTFIDLAGELEAHITSGYSEAGAAGHDAYHSVIGGLGADILDAVYALYDIAKQNAGVPAPGPVRAAHLTNNGDQLLALGYISSDLNFRLQQVDREIDMAGFLPQLRTGCDVSATDRSKLMHGGTFREKADFNKVGTGFKDEIGWAYHYGSRIDAAALTPDTLYIEDAVGKTADGDELANAHWFAKIYGAEEGNPNAPVTGDLAAGPGAAAQGALIVPNCLFNQLRPVVRQQFFQARGLAIGSFWEVNFINNLASGGGGYTGKLVVGVNGNYEFTYQFSSLADQVLRADAQDFILTTANSVVEDFIVQELAISGYSRRYPAAANLTNKDIKIQMTTRHISTAVPAGQKLLLEKLT